jgi:putative YhgA-like transposase
MARSRTDLPHDFPDRALGEALLQGDNLRALLREVAPAIADQLDYERLEVVPPTFLLDDWRRRESDLLLRVPFRDAAAGRELLLCILLEHQSTADHAMPLRMLVYAVLYWEQEWKAWEDGHPRG